MTIDLTDTTTGAISSALTEARRRLGGQTTGMVLTLLIVTDEAAQYDAIRAANQAAREHPSRILAIITRKPKAESRLDAEIRVGESSPGETIVLRMYGPLGQHADSVAAPLLVPDVPVVTWWPENGPAVPSAHPLGALAQRRVTDSAADDDPRRVLAGLARAYVPGDTDFGWTRATPWRSLLAATLDQPHPTLEAGEVSAEADNPTADLIAAWLGLRLGIGVQRTNSGGPGITGVTFTTADGDIAISRPDGRTATLAWPGRPDRMVALHRRETAELLAEELRRLDPDELYEETLCFSGAFAFQGSFGPGGAAPLSPPAWGDQSPQPPLGGDKLPGGGRPVGEQPVGEQPVGERPVGERPVSEDSTGEEATRS